MKIAYFDKDKNSLELRDATPEEEGAIKSASNGASFEMKNYDVLTKLAEIDTKSIRALMESDQARIDSFNAEKAVLRAQLIRD